MKRRASSRIVVVLAALVAFGLLTSLRGPAALRAQQQPVTLRIQAEWPSGFTLYDHLASFARRVEELSGGRLRIEHFPAGAVVPGIGTADAVSRGVIDGGHVTTFAASRGHPANVPLTHGPVFGMDNIDMFGWYWEGGGLALLNEFYQKVLKLDVTALPVTPAGPQPLGWFKGPVRSWEDLKTYRFRTYGIDRDVRARAGMPVVAMPAPETLAAARAGALDGAEWVGGVEDLKLGFHRVWKFHLTPGMHEQVTWATLLLNKTMWDGLAPDLRAIVEAAATETSWRWWVRWQRQNADAYREMIGQHGVQVLRTPDDVNRAFLRHWDEIWKEEAAKDPFYRKVIDSQREYAKQVVPYRRSTWPEYRFLADHYWKGEIYAK